MNSRMAVTLLLLLYYCCEREAERRKKRILARSTYQPRSESVLRSAGKPHARTLRKSSR